jgi:hypothetical protein
VDYLKEIQREIDGEWRARQTRPEIVIEEQLRQPARNDTLFLDGLLPHERVTPSGIKPSSGAQRILRVPPMQMQAALNEVTEWARGCFLRGEPIALNGGPPR